MERIIKYITYLWMSLFIFCFSGCADEIVNQSQNKGEGTLLNLYADFQGAANTRLAELPADQIGTEAGIKKYKNVGLYIYYQDDYDAGDLSKPYIRNLEMTYDATDKKLVATGISSEIYIYDRMKIVALYPYNANAADFVTKDDEESYYFSESDYKDQYYIPYRAADNINPTNAYTAQLHFSPKQTCKVQIVLTANDPTSFPTYTGGNNNKLPADQASITILPDVDPVATTYTQGVDRREQWIDSQDALPKDISTTVVGGKYVRRFNAYIWTTDAGKPHHDGYTHNGNIIEQGKILFHSDKLTLVVPATVNLAEQQVYRYGYDMDSGEMFIPTSETLVYDATSLKEVSFNSNRVYQVCDIDLSSIASWTPKDLYDATYDGGGHAIKGMKIDAMMKAAADDEKPGIQAFGLFATLGGTSRLMNMHVVAPQIAIAGAASKDTCYVGGLCGLLNPELSLEDRKKKIKDGLPEELSEPVREALLAEALRSLGSTTCTIEGCKVENPKITVSNAPAVVAGGFCGGAGNQTQTGNITESYLAQTSDDSFIKVNEADADWKAVKTTPYVGSFCGLLHNGTIEKSYTAMAKNVTASYSTGTTPAKKEAAVGFCYVLKGNVAKDCRTAMTSGITAAGAGAAKNIEVAAVTKFSTQWVSWELFKDQSNPNFNKWPCIKWTNYWVDLGSSPSTYPTLMWEYKPYLENE